MPKHRSGSSTGARRRKSHKRRAGGHIPIKVLEHRLARLGQIVSRRKGLRATSVSLTR